MPTLEKGEKSIVVIIMGKEGVGMSYLAFSVAVERCTSVCGSNLDNANIE